GACRSAGNAVAPVRTGALLRGISRQPDAAGGDLPGASARLARLALRAGLQALRARERAWRQRPEAPRRRGVADGASRRADALAQLVERASHQSCRRLD